jgi:hypothetical protein
MEAPALLMLMTIAVVSGLQRGKRMITISEEPVLMVGFTNVVLKLFVVYPTSAKG